eukprot:1914879-Rhodomonas_salina.2
MAKDVYVERGGVVLTRSKLGLGSGWGGILLGGEGIAAARSWCVLVVGGGWTTATCGSSEIVPRPSVVPCFCLGVSEDRNWGPGSGSAWKQFCVLGVLTASSGTGCGRRRRESVGFALDGPAVSSRVCVKAHSLELTDWTTQGRKVRSRHRATRNPFRDCWHRWGSEPLRVPCEGTWVFAHSGTVLCAKGRAKHVCAEAGGAI